MKIKSLLIGSAAALVAATGANAADAVVVAAEPEPVEYVRVCDAYGSGFFYIPGTETCLGISGYVFLELGATGDQGLAAGDTPNYHGYPGGQYTAWVRGRFNVDARSDTEWGTLRGFLRLQGNWYNGGISGDAGVAMDQAYIEVGGFRMGYTESAWATAMGHGSATWGGHSWYGLNYGYQQRTLIAYTFQGGNGFAATISVEDDANANYAPDVVAQISVNQGWGAVWVKVGYDEETSDLQPVALGITGDEFGVTGGVQLNVPNSPGSSLRVIGYYASGDTNYGVAPFSRTTTNVGAAEWSVLASYRHAFAANVAGILGVQYFNDLYVAGTAVNSTVDVWQVEGEYIWEPVTNFDIRASLAYREANVAGASGSVSGYLRFTRSF